MVYDSVTAILQRPAGMCIRTEITSGERYASDYVRSNESKQTTKTTHRRGTENTAGETAKLTRAQTTNLMEERMGNWNGF